MKARNKVTYCHHPRAFFYAAVVISCLACGTRLPETKPEQHYFVATTARALNTRLLTYYPCLDTDCKRVDIFPTKQTIELDGNEYIVSRGEHEITGVFETGPEAFLILRNNHSTYICELCSEGTLDYLTEADELDSAKVDDLSSERGQTSLRLVVQYTDKDSGTRGVFKKDVLLGGGYPECGPILRKK